MTGPKLVQLRERPVLTDLAARLEDLARQVRSGECPATEALIVLADDEDRISVRAFGAVRSAAHSIGLLKMAGDFLCDVSTTELENQPPPEAA